jgi:enoyl-CoA hydratase/carnithine racemase
MLSKTLIRISRARQFYPQKKRLSEVAAVLEELAKPVPPSVYSIPTGSAGVGDSGVVIREVGCTRRIFLLKPHLSVDEIEGLAHRLRMLSKNAGLNSILIATNDDDDAETGALPTSAVEMDTYGSREDPFEISHPDDKIFYVSGGYDPLEMYKTGQHRDDAFVQKLLESVSELAMAARGDAKTTRIPVITLPHGLVHDGGYALCMGGYVLATEDTCFRIMNPSRGLSFDPVGFSFILPRLGWEFQQPSADYNGCGLLLALAGLEADASDMMETGLATHYIDSPAALGTFERALSELPPWEQQNLYRKPIRYYGQPENKDDVNAEFRNVSVANLIHSFSTYNARGTDIFTNCESDFTLDDDPSVDLDYEPLHVTRESDLVNYAATLDFIFKNERTVDGILNRLKEIAERGSTGEEVGKGIQVVKDLVKRIQRQSPLALSVVFKLMQLGAKKGESLASCMERERRAQAKMFKLQDFENWAKHATRDLDGQPFAHWQHKHLSHVPSDLVDDIVGE